MQLIEELLSLAMLTSTLRLALPLAFGALGGFLSERSGVAQVGLEGMMLIGALAAACAAHFTQSAGAGIFAAILAGGTVAAVMALFVLWMSADQIVVGMALNLFVFGLAPFVTKLLFDSTGSSPSLPASLRLNEEYFFLFAFCFLFILYVFHKTFFGLCIRFAGDKPEVLLARGVSVRQVRFINLLGCGALAGLGGSTLSLMLASSYSPMMTAGRGFISLAAIIFGGWKPLPTLAACLLFAFADALQIRLQGALTVPVQFIQILPYMITILVLAFMRRPVG